MFGRGSRGRNRRKIPCDHCGIEFSLRELKQKQVKHRDPNHNHLIVMQTFCPNCGGSIDSYRNEEENRRTNKYGVGWSPRR